MKTAIYIEDGVTQIVLTPETRLEKDVFVKIDEGTQQISINKGSFYESLGGWIRHGEDENSLIIRKEIDK